MRLGREHWVEAAMAALTDGGIDAVRVETVAKQLGVTKGSFYHHFENRRVLHLAMLETWEQLGTHAIIDLVEQEQTPESRLRNLVQVTIDTDPESDAAEAAIRSWAATDPVAAEVAERVDHRRIEYVVGLLVDYGMERRQAQRRANLLYLSLIHI